MRIERASRVVELGGRLVSSQQLRRLIACRDADPTLPYVDSIIADDDLHLVLPPGSAQHFGNHSCDPNLWWKDAFTLVARRDIPSDVELTNDYATSTADSAFCMACRCGSELCRGMITGDDWRRPELRRRYESRWVPALLKRLPA